MSQPVVEVRGIGKKFCRSLRRSIWYGFRDLAGELIGRSGERSTLRRDEFWAVRGLSVDIEPGETLGLIGPNGAGKTTTLRMLYGLIKPDEGSIVVRGRMQALIALGAGFSPVLSGRENIYVNASILGIPRREVDRRFDAIVDFAGIPDFIDAPVQSYSSGMTVRLGFAVAAHLEPDVLLVDEVLAVGDEGFQVKCLNKIGELRVQGTAIVLVSHNMHAISTYCDRVLVQGVKGHQVFSDVSEGVGAYKGLVHSGFDDGIEKHCSGVPGLEFFRVDLPAAELDLGGDFHVRLHYDASAPWNNVEVDVALQVAGETGWHYQATNRTFEKDVHLPEGKGWLDITVHDLRTVHAEGRFAIAVWRQDRSGLLFWWRVPVRFRTMARSAGAALYRTTFRTHCEPGPEVVEGSELAERDVPRIGGVSNG